MNYPQSGANGEVPLPRSWESACDYTFVSAGPMRLHSYLDTSGHLGSTILFSVYAVHLLCERCISWCDDASLAESRGPSSVALIL